MKHATHNTHTHMPVLESSFKTIECGTRFDDRSSTCLLSARHDLLIIHDFTIYGFLYLDYRTEPLPHTHTHTHTRARARTHTYTDTHLRSVSNIHKNTGDSRNPKAKGIILLSTRKFLSLLRETRRMFSVLEKKCERKISSQSGENLRM